MTRLELIERISTRQDQLSSTDVELAVKMIVEHMVHFLTLGERIEIRGFGSFSLRYHAPKKARNPITGNAVNVIGKHAIHFKPGKELRERVNEGRCDLL